MKRDQVEALIREGLSSKVAECISVKVKRGEASIVTVRGKRKLGYDLDLEVNFKIDGTNILVKMQEVSDDSEDCEFFQVTPQNSKCSR